MRSAPAVASVPEPGGGPVQADVAGAGGALPEDLHRRARRLRARGQRHTEPGAERTGERSDQVRDLRGVAALVHRREREPVAAGTLEPADRGDLEAARVHLVDLRHGPEMGVRYHIPIRLQNGASPPMHLRIPSQSCRPAKVLTTALRSRAG